MIIGKLSRIPMKDNREQPFAFIRAEDNKEYFLHKSELFDDWDDLKRMIASKGEVTIEFEGVKAEKGFRATGAKIVRN